MVNGLLGGLLVAVVMKYADNILMPQKGFASLPTGAGAIILTGLSPAPTLTL